MAEYVPIVTTLNVNNMFNIAWEVVQHKKLIYIPSLDDERINSFVPILHEAFQSPFLALKTNDGYYLSFSIATKTLCLLYKNLLVPSNKWRVKNVSTRKLFENIIASLEKEAPKSAPIMISNVRPVIFALNNVKELEEEMVQKGVKKEWGYLTPTQ